MGFYLYFEYTWLHIRAKTFDFYLIYRRKYFNRFSYQDALEFVPEKYQDFKNFTHGEYLTTRLVTKQTHSNSIWVKSDKYLLIFVDDNVRLNCFGYCMSNLLDSCGPEANPHI